VRGSDGQGRRKAAPLQRWPQSVETAAALTNWRAAALTVAARVTAAGNQRR